MNWAGVNMVQTNEDGETTIVFTVGGTDFDGHDYSVIAKFKSAQTEEEEEAIACKVRRGKVD